MQILDAKSIDDLGEIFYSRQFVKCHDVSSYFIGGLHYVLELNQYGIAISKFQELDLKNNESSVEFNNVDNAFIFDNVLYLLNGDVIQEIIL